MAYEVSITHIFGGGIKGSGAILFGTSIASALSDGKRASASR